MVNEEYNKLLIELYKDNQAFLNKAIFGVSSLAIPLLFKAISNEISTSVRWCFVITLVLFLLVIVCQIISLKYAKNGCDKGMPSKNEDRLESGKLFDIARCWDKWREGFFLVALAMIAFVFIIKTVNMENEMTKKSQGAGAQTTRDDRSYVPPKSMEQTTSSETETSTGETTSDKNKDSED